MITNNPLIYWLRWLGVITGALLAGIAASFPLHWILYSALRNETIFVDPYPELPERILFPYMMAISFVWAGSYTAPEHRFKTAVVLFGVWLFLLGGAVFLTLTGSEFIGRQLYFQDGGIGPITAVAGALTGLFIVKKKEFGAKAQNQP